MKHLFPLIALLAYFMSNGQQLERYTANNCNCFIYYGYIDSTETFKPSHVDIDRADSLARLKFGKSAYNLYKRYYKGLVFNGQRILKIQGINDQNPDGAWTTIYYIDKETIDNLHFYGG